MTTTAIVTGASRGLGLGIARALADEDHDVVVAAPASDHLESAAADVGGRAIACDVTSPSDIRRLFEQAGRDVGVVVNNAAAPVVLDPLAELRVERFRLGFEVDVFGTLLVSQAAAGALTSGGTIVNVVAARGGVPAGPAHLSVSPSQAALWSLTRQLAAILEERGIAVHALMPRLSKDGETGRVAAPAVGRDIDKEPLTAAEVGAAVVALLDQSRSSTWSVDGGAGLSELL